MLKPLIKRLDNVNNVEAAFIVETLKRADAELTKLNDKVKDMEERDPDTIFEKLEEMLRIKIKANNLSPNTMNRLDAKVDVGQMLYKVEAFYHHNLGEDKTELKIVRVATVKPKPL